MELIESTDLESVPVFPLPDFVLFPNTLVPFHIFEPRYVQMMEECLAGTRNVIITGLLPGWESDYYGTPPIHRTGCVGKVVNEERLDDGRLNIYVHGLARVTVGGAIQTKPYRIAPARVMSDLLTDSPELQRERELRLRMVAHELIQLLGQGGEPLAKLLSNTASLGPLTYRLASLIVSDPAERQLLLETRTASERADRLVENFAHIILQLAGSGKRGDEAFTRH